MENQLNNAHKLLEVARFSIVGLVATFIHAFVYLIAVERLLMNAQIANLCGFIIAFVFSYLGQKHFTFSRSYSRSLKKELFKFLSVSLSGLCLNSFWVFLVKNILNLAPAYATFGIITITPLLTFFAFKYWVFKK